MSLDRSWSLLAQPLIRLTQQAPIDEIGSFTGPAVWDLLTLNLDLFREHLVLDFLS